VPHEGRLEVHERQAGVGAGEAGILPDRLREQRRGRRVVGPVEAVHVLQAEMVGRPRVEVLGDREPR